MPDSNEDSGERRRLMHRRSVECEGYLRHDGLWEVEARLVDTKPFVQHDRYRGVLQPGEPVHDISLRLAIDDRMTIIEAETTMRSTPYPTCIEVEPILQRLVGERIGKGWRELVRQKIGRLETCTHLAELLGPAVTALFQTMSLGKSPESRDALEDQRSAASGRSSSAAVTPGEPTGPSSPRCFRNLRPSPRATTEQSGGASPA